MLPEVVNKKAVLQKLEEIIEDKSKAYADNLVDVRSFEMVKTKNIGKKFTEEQTKDYEVIKNIANTKSPKDFKKALSKFTKDQYANFNEIRESKSSDEGLEYAQNALKDLREFLEVVNQLKEEVEK